MDEGRKELEGRIKSIEDAVSELGSKDLMLAKMIVATVAPMSLNIVTRTLGAEEWKQFEGVFSKKSNELKAKLKEAKTVEKVFQLLAQFDSEISDYVRAAKVDTADKAMEIAHSFIKKYSAVALPLKAVREDDVWMVDIDVGALAVKIAKVKVDARTGDILSYEIPEKK